MERSHGYGNAPFWWNSSVGSRLKEVLEGHKYSQNIGKRTGKSIGKRMEPLKTLREITQLREGELGKRGRESNGGKKKRSWYSVCLGSLRAGDRCARKMNAWMWGKGGEDMGSHPKQIHLI